MLAAMLTIALQPNLPPLADPDVPRLYADLPNADLIDAGLSLEAGEPYVWVAEAGESFEAVATVSEDAEGDVALLTVWDWHAEPVAQQRLSVPCEETVQFQVEGRGTYLLTLDLIQGDGVAARLVRGFSVCPDGRARRDEWRAGEFMLGTCAFPGREHWTNDYGDGIPRGLTEQETREIDAELSARLGLQIVRPDISATWASENADIDFERCDAALGAWTSRGFQLDLQVGRPPAEWAILPQYANVTDPKWRYPRREGPSRRWIREVVGRYAADAAFIELYNEPDNFDFWRGTPEEFVEWSGWAAEEARQAAPGVPIVNGGYCMVEPEMTGVFARELLGLIDGVAYHSHGGVDDLSHMREAMIAVHAAAGYEKPFFINTEMGYAAWRYDIERLQASTAIQKTLCCWAHGDRAALLFCSRWGVGPRLIEGDPDWGYIDHFMCPRFMYGAVSAFVDWYAGAVFESILLETPQKHAYRFTRGDETIVAVFSPIGGYQPISVTSNASAARIIDPMGNATDAPDPTRVDLKLGDYPVTIILEGATEVHAS